MNILIPNLNNKDKTGLSRIVQPESMVNRRIKANLILFKNSNAKFASQLKFKQY